MTDIREALVETVWISHTQTRHDVEQIADAILAEFDVTPRGEAQWWESLVEAPCDKGHRIFIDDGDGGVYACPACALPPTVKPSVEVLSDALAGEGIDALPGELDLTDMAERLLALLPGRSEAEVRREAAEEAWGEGYLRGVLDTTSDLEPADNPYRKEADRG